MDNFGRVMVNKLDYPYIFTNPSARVGYDQGLFLKRSLTSLNSEFSFSQTSCFTKAEEAKLDNQTFTNEFESHWVPHSSLFHIYSKS